MNPNEGGKLPHIEKVPSARRLEDYMRIDIEAKFPTIDGLREYLARKVGVGIESNPEEILKAFDEMEDSDAKAFLDPEVDVLRERIEKKGKTGQAVERAEEADQELLEVKARLAKIRIGKMLGTGETITWSDMRETYLANSDLGDGLEDADIEIMNREADREDEERRNGISFH